MAGRGSRLRPHTLSTPKPLIPVGGIPIVHRLVADIAAVCAGTIKNIGFVIGDFGEAVEKDLIDIAAQFGAKGHIYHQTEPLGTGHAVLCGHPLLEGPVVVAFADTLFRADFKIDDQDDGIIWVKKIENPSAFGVIKLNESHIITDYIEKPQTWVSDLAMIGVYYIKDGGALKRELDHLIEHGIMNSGEYQLPDAFRQLTATGTRFKPGEVQDWLDCGNKVVTVETNQRVLDFDLADGKALIAKSSNIKNSVVIPPCFIGEGVSIENSVVGPHVSLGANSAIYNARINNCLIQDHTQINNISLTDSMVGRFAQINGRAKDISAGDYTEWND